MIDGLKSTMTGEALRGILRQRIDWHREREAWWINESLRTPEEQTDDHPWLPRHLCEHESEYHAWRGEVLAFMHDHLEVGETYRLTSSDLDDGELLPLAPASVEQEDDDERSRIGFSLERLVKSVDRLAIGLPSSLRRRARLVRSGAGRWTETVVEETDEFRTTRIDVEDGPEILKIERK